MTVMRKDIGEIHVSIMTVVAWFGTVIPVVVGIVMYVNVLAAQIEEKRINLERQLIAQITAVKMEVSGFDRMIQTIDKQADNQTQMLKQLAQMAEQIKNLQVGITDLQNNASKK